VQGGERVKPIATGSQAGILIQAFRGRKQYWAFSDESRYLARETLQPKRDRRPSRLSSADGAAGASRLLPLGKHGVGEILFMRRRGQQIWPMFLKVLQSEEIGTMAETPLA